MMTFRFLMKRMTKMMKRKRNVMEQNMNFLMMMMKNVKVLNMNFQMMTMTVPVLNKSFRCFRCFRDG